MDTSLSQVIERRRRHEHRLHQALASIRAQLIEMGALRIVLFGSVAAGETNSRSDLDLLVIMPASRTGKEWTGHIYAELDRTVDCDILFYLALFLSQQSAEKALKALLLRGEREQVFTHSVAVLLKIASEMEPEFAALGRAKRLDEYYIPTRYRNGLPGDTPANYYDDQQEAEDAYGWARDVVVATSQGGERRRRGCSGA